MGFKVGACVTVWNVSDTSKGYINVQVSTSIKNLNTGQYESDFQGIARFCKDAIVGTEKLVKGSRIRITSCDVTRTYDKDKNKEYVNFIVYGWEPADTALLTDTESDSLIEVCGNENDKKLINFTGTTNAFGGPGGQPKIT